jgi:hypothetical protein
MKASKSLIASMLAFALALPPPAQVAAQSTAAPAPATASTAAVKSFSQPELDQLVAPIALYPDDLLAQILMASTYPLEIVQADRWVKANSSLKGKALDDALQAQPWDPSVKSLAVIPQVLTMMSEKLDWTQKLGDAFLASQSDVMATAQALRRKAADQGNLKDSKEQRVITETVQNTTIIKIEPTNPEVVYVPTYNPTVVYGSWPYPAYPPYYWYPPAYYYPPGYYPGYAAGAAFWGFTAGVIVGAALWGNCIWGGGSVNINVNKYNNFNRSNISNGNWRHNVNHRGSVPYRDKGVAQQYGRGQRQARDVASRESFRGRADAGRQSLARGDVSRDLAGRNMSSRDAGRAGGGATAGTRDAGARAGSGDLGGRSPSAGGGSRDFGGLSQTSSNFSGRDTSGIHSPTALDTGRSTSTRDFSNRGSSSMSGGARGGGGGGRGGGGRR